jgi:hypothetical protein
MNPKESAHNSSQNEGQMFACSNSFDKQILISPTKDKTTIKPVNDCQKSSEDCAQLCLTNTLHAAYKLTTIMPSSSIYDLANFHGMMEKRRTLKMLNMLEACNLEQSR